METYQGFPYTTFIDKNVRDELNERQAIDSRTRNINAWVKITSGVEQKFRNDGPEDHYELRTLSSLLVPVTVNPYSLNFKDVYDVNNKPLPGITGFDVSYKSKYGGIRKASIDFGREAFAPAQ